MDNTQASLLEKELLKLKTNNKIPDAIKNSINYNIALSYYLKRNYEKAIPLFMDNIIQKNYLYEPLFICAMYSQLEKELTDVVYLKTTKDIDELMKFYIAKKEKQDNDVLMKIIMKDILPKQLIHESYYNPIWSMFENELLMIVKKQKKYMKFYLEYVKIMKKTCKDL